MVIGSFHRVANFLAMDRRMHLPDNQPHGIRPAIEKTVD